MGMAAPLCRDREVEGQVGSSVSPFDSVNHAGEAATRVTRKEIRVMNPVALKRSFPSLWAEYLRANFTSPGAVSRAFPGIDEKTCRDWWSGKRNPSGCFVAAVVSRDMRAMEILGREA